MNESILIAAKEAFFARMMPVFSEVSIDAIARFKRAEYFEHALAAGLASLVAYAILYLIGTRMRALPKHVSTPEQRERIDIMAVHAGFWLPYLLVLAPSPFGTVVLLAAGFFAMRPWKVALIVSGAEIVWRLLPIIT